MSAAHAQGAGGISEAAKQIMRELELARMRTQQGSAANNAASVEFQEAMTRAQETMGVRDTNFSAQVRNNHQQAARAAQVLREAAANPPSAAESVVGDSNKRETSELFTFFQKVMQSQDSMNEAMDTALSAKDIGPMSMMELQVGVYHAVQEIELSVKSVDHISSNVKQTANMQF